MQNDNITQTIKENYKTYAEERLAPIEALQVLAWCWILFLGMRCDRMKADRELYSRLEDIHFEYERITSVVSILQQFISEGCVDVTGLPKNVIYYCENMPG